VNKRHVQKIPSKKHDDCNEQEAKTPHLEQPRILGWILRNAKYRDTDENGKRTEHPVNVNEIRVINPELANKK